MKIRMFLCILLGSSSGCSQINKLDPVVPHGDATGRSIAAVQIDSAPTPAWIYVDDVFVGTTPMEHQFNFDHTDRSIDIVAEPLPYNNAQIRQRRSFSLPPLPTRVHFNMNNPNRLLNYE